MNQKWSGMVEFIDLFFSKIVYMSNSSVQSPSWEAKNYVFALLGCYAA
jgi:hypothetical protein